MVSSSQGPQDIQWDFPIAGDAPWSSQSAHPTPKVEKRMGERLGQEEPSALRVALSDH